MKEGRRQKYQTDVKNLASRAFIMLVSLLSNNLPLAADAERAWWRAMV